MTDRNAALADFEQSYAEVKTAFGALNDEQFRYRPAGDPWSVASLVTHVGVAMLFNKAMLQAARSGGQIPPAHFESLRQITASADSDDRSLILSRLEDHKREYLDYVATLPREEDERELPFVTPRGTRSITTLQSITGLAGHCREHLEQLRSWNVPSPTTA
ncbi:MAG: DinB family protein [Chloroflexi bacterium]|nr:DinB family protein [Chloroflexota bacterium]